VPGRVPQRPRLPKLIRQGASNRSMVAALAASTLALTLLSNWP
jgi:hypothetical protein